MKHAGVWIVAEQAGGRVQSISHELLTRGRELADRRGVQLTALLLGNAVAAAELDELIARGADRVLLVEHPELEYFRAEPYARVCEALIGKYRPEIIIAGATSLGRTLMPYLAVRVRAGLTADCTILDVDPATGNLLQTRPAIGGNILATIQTPNARPQLATVRPKSTRPAARQPGRRGAIEREPVAGLDLSSGCTRVGFIPDADEVGIGDAAAVVAGGRGFKTAEKFRQLHRLAAALGAAVGASRDAVDRGWISYPHQVGLSGRTVTPKLYLALGISGAIQHLAGMQTAETVVAVNSDPDAMIFHVADFGIVGDLHEVLPVLIQKLQARPAGAGKA